MNTKYLINNDGNTFNPSELEYLSRQLDSLKDVDREDYRNKNASAIAKNTANRFLIVSGPGTGKSFLFLERIHYWSEQVAWRNGRMRQRVTGTVGFQTQLLRQENHLSTYVGLVGQKSMVQLFHYLSTGQYVYHQI